MIVNTMFNRAAAEMSGLAAENVDAHNRKRDSIGVEQMSRSNGLAMTNSIVPVQQNAVAHNKQSSCTHMSL